MTKNPGDRMTTCYICRFPVERKWQKGGSRPVCTNPKCAAPQDDAEAYLANKVRAMQIMAKGD